MTTIKQLSHQTGLTVSYIRKCLDYLANVVTPYTHRGTHNAILLDSNGLVIFERVRELKQDGLALPDIKAVLEKEFETGALVVPRRGEPTPKTSERQENQVLNELLSMQARLTDEMTARLDDTRHHARELAEKDKEISDLERKNEVLSMSLRMLPDGKPPDVIRSEYDEQRRKLSEKAHREQEAAHLLAELQQSLGLFQGKKRRELLKQLETLLS